MTTPEIDLGRETSNLLVEVRTVLSRAEEALLPGRKYRSGGAKPGEWISKATLVPSWDDTGGWLSVPGGGVQFHQYEHEMPHPDREEIRAALEEVVRLLSPWRRTGRPKGRKRG